MDINDIALVREHCHLVRFLKDCRSYVQGGNRPLDFYGDPDTTKEERAIISGIERLIEENERLRVSLRDAEQRP